MAKDGRNGCEGLCMCRPGLFLTVMAVQMTYLADALSGNEDAILKSVMVLIMQEVLPALLAYVIQIFSCNNKTLLRIVHCSTFVYSMGLFVLYLSASNRIPSPGFELFIFAGFLISVGKAGGVPLLKTLLSNQIEACSGSKGIDKWLSLQWILVSWTGFLISFADSLSRTFMILIVLMGLACLLLLCGNPFYHVSQLTETNLRLFTILFDDYKPLCKSDGQQHKLEPQQRISRSTSRSKEEQLKAGKVLLKMIPMCSTYIVFGLVRSTVTNFSNMQDDNMNTKIPIFLLFSFKTMLKVAIPHAYDFLIYMLRFPESKRNQALVIRICFGMMVSVLCPSLAWWIESLRLKLVNRSRLMDNTDETAMAVSNLWLVLLFGLLGVMDGLAKDGLNKFTSSLVSEMSMDGSGTEIFNAIPFGIGSFINGFCVYACKNWFADTLDHSRLDKYYKMITVVAAVNLCWVFFLSKFYMTKKALGDDEKHQESTDIGVV